MNCYFGHHRSGSSYIRSILESVSVLTGKHIQTVHNLDELSDLNQPDILITSNSSMEYLKNIEFEKGFHVIRDPRDVVVSSYFSHKISHKTNVWTDLVSHREYLNKISFEEGLIYEIQECRRSHFHELGDWNYNQENILELKFENLITDLSNQWLQILNFLDFQIRHDSLGAFSPMIRNYNKLIKKLNAQYPASFTRHIYLDHSIHYSEIQVIIDSLNFKNKTGRTEGIEDINNHYRKGISGDWKNHFSPKITEVFKKEWGELLIKLGYENDHNW